MVQLALVLGLLGPPTQGPAGQDPRVVAAAALAAVEGESAAPVAGRWQDRLRRDPSDRVATLGLATLARLSYDDQRADSLYEWLIAANEGRADRIAAHARFGQSLGLRARGLAARADSAFDRAREAAHAAADSILEAEVLLEQAAVRLRTRGPVAGAVVLRQASALAQTDLRLQALEQCVRGELFVLATRDAARAHAVAGAELAERVGDRRLRARCLQAVAASLGDAGQVDSALAVYGHVIAERRRLGDEVGLAQSLQWRGTLYWIEGVYGLAQRDLREAVAVGEHSGNSSAVLWARSSLASLAIDLGDLGTGAAQANHAIGLARAQGDRYAVARVLALRGRLAEDAGEFGSARDLYRAALDELEELGLAPVIVDLHTGLAHLAMRDRRWADAETELGRATSVARRFRLSEFEWGLYYHRGVLALRRGRLEAAATTLTEGLRGVRPDQGDWQYFFAARLAEVYVRRGEIARAEAELTRATQALQAWRASLDDRQLRLLALRRSIDPSDPDLGFATVVAALAQHGRAAIAFALSERLRARHLLDELERGSALRGADSRAIGTDASLHPPAAVTQDEVVGALPDARTALVEFVTGRGDEPTMAFVLSRRGTQAVVLTPEDSLVGLVPRFRVLLESGGDPRPLGRVLGRALLDAMLAQLPPDVRRLVIVPDGVLHRLPFDALVTSDDHFLVERFAVTVAPSAAVAVRLWQRPTRSAPPTLLAFADPAFQREADTASGGDVFQSAFDGTGALPRLEGSAREVRAVARYVPDAVILRRAGASEARLKREPLRGYGILHFATHALVDEGVLNRTALVLSAGDGEDGLVNPGELSRLTLEADFVVLSACQTAGGVLVRGEGLQGLTAPLLQAGARAVLASNWRVGDRGTARLVEDVYRSLAAGLPVADALRAAKLEALWRGAPGTEWAAFTLVGDPGVQLALRLPRAGPPWPAIAAVALLGLLAYGAWMRKRSATERRTAPSVATARTHHR